jgi:hypothetical protein
LYSCGVDVESLKHLCSIVEGGTAENLRFDLDDECVIVLKIQNVKLATSRSIKRHIAMANKLVYEQAINCETGKLYTN